MGEDAINDIIRREEDRLFIIDRECCIIYTGSSLEDERPFIRVGNYIDLPAEIIPLIENIVVTDLLVGNPACEQFNIDIKTLPDNRYIGSRHVVNKYLNFQRIFGLDLQNATIVDVEKDIPFLSKKKDLADRDSFIGIFYTNGNFRIKRRQTDIMDLERETSASFNEAKLLGQLAGAARESKRYDGDGVVFVGSNPLFYKHRQFTSYHFPKRFLEEFAALSIDPDQIREAVHPSPNFIHITRLIKLKHSRGGRLRIFSNYHEQFDHIQRLFSGASLSRKDFDGFTLETANGLSIRNYPGTYNIRLNWGRTKPERLDLSLAYIKGPRGVEDIVRERLDGILVHYSVYEELSLLIKSSNIAVAIVADPGLSRGKLRDHSVPILHSGIQYEFRKYATAGEVLPDMSHLFGSAPPGADSPAQEIEDLGHSIASEAKEMAAENIGIFAAALNRLSFFRCMLAVETDRKRTAALRKAVQEISLALGRGALARFDPASFRVVLAFCRGSAYEFLEISIPSSRPGSRIIEDISEERLATGADSLAAGEAAFYRRVLDDRKRLARLLELYRPRSEEKGFRDIEKAIVRRKEDYYTEEPRTEEESAPGAGKTPPLKTAAGFLVVFLAILITFFLVTGHIRKWDEEQARQAALREARERTELIDRYGISVSPHEIYVYANEVAVRNGYRQITFKGLKEKNPNWIYPGNRFVLDGNDSVTVREGDTLWDIAHGRLLDRSVRFYRLCDEIKAKKESGADFSGDLTKAEGLAFNESHRKIIAELRGKGPDGSKGQK